MTGTLTGWLVDVCWGGRIAARLAEHGIGLGAPVRPTSDSTLLLQSLRRGLSIGNLPIGPASTAPCGGIRPSSLPPTG
jgi:hypothetical protein